MKESWRDGRGWICAGWGGSVVFVLWHTDGVATLLRRMEWMLVVSKHFSISIAEIVETCLLGTRSWVLIETSACMLDRFLVIHILQLYVNAVELSLPCYGRQMAELSYREEWMHVFSQYSFTKHPANSSNSCSHLLSRF